MPSLRMSIPRTLLAVAVAAVLLGYLIVPVSRLQEWNRLHGQIGVMIRQLKPSPSSSVNLSTWDCAHELVIAAYANVCFGPQHTTTAEMHRLRNDLESRLAGEVDLETLKWLWNRLGETGAHGRSYIERNRPWFRDCLPLSDPTTGFAAPSRPGPTG